MKNTIWVLIAIATVLVLAVALMEFRERGFFSSYAAPPEKPAPLQTAGQTQTYNFDSARRAKSLRVSMGRGRGKEPRANGW
jgi:hypothetical protein